MTGRGGSRRLVASAIAVGMLAIAAIVVVAPRRPAPFGWTLGEWGTSGRGGPTPPLEATSRALPKVDTSTAGSRRDLVTGRVLDAATRNPLRNVVVSRHDAGHAAALTDPGGRYCVLLDDHGEALRFEKSGYAPVVVALGTDAAQDDVLLEPSGVATLFVSRGGAPAPAVTIHVSGRRANHPFPDLDRVGEAPIATTDIQGVATIAVASPTYVHAIGARGDVAGGVVRPGERTELALPLAGARLRIEEEDGRDLDRPVWISLQAVNETGDMLVRFDPDDPDRAPLLAVGVWTVTIHDRSRYMSSILVRGQERDPDVARSGVVVRPGDGEMAVRLAPERFVRLVDVDTRTPLSGEFWHGRILQDRRGEWIDAIPRRGVAEADGRSAILPGFHAIPDHAFQLTFVADGYRKSFVSDDRVRVSWTAGMDLDVAMRSAPPTGLRLVYRDGTPYRATIGVYAVGELGPLVAWSGDTGHLGVVEGIQAAPGDGLRVDDAFRRVVATVEPGALDIGAMNEVVVDLAYGRIRLIGVPSGASPITAVNPQDDLHYAFIDTDEGVRLSEPLPAGDYYVGPADLVREERFANWGGFGKRNLPSSSRIEVPPDREVVIRWSARWNPTPTIEGRVHFTGGWPGPVSLTPHYSDPLGSVRADLGERVYPSSDGRYSFTPTIRPPRLVVCVGELGGRPVPVDVVPPGGDVLVRRGSARLTWAGEGAEVAWVSCVVDTGAFRVPVKLFMPRLDTTWRLAEPVELPLPVGTHRVEVHVVGSAVIEREVRVTDGGVFEVLVGD